MIFGINTTCDVSKLSQIHDWWNYFTHGIHAINITTNHANTYTNIPYITINFARCKTYRLYNITKTKTFIFCLVHKMELILSLLP